MIRRTLAAVLLVTLSIGPLGAPATAWARAIAVVEFRAGAEGGRDVGLRLAALLRRLTSHQVTDPVEARRRSRGGVDAAIARCAGNATCLGRVARRLGVDEVIVVGVSDLGDLILALQRVDAATGEITGRVADSLPRGREPDDEGLTTYLKRLLPPADFLRWGTLAIRADVAGAAVHVAGARRGITPLPPLRLKAPTTIDVRVSKRGYVDFTARIDVLPDTTVEVRPILSPRPAPAWYGRWWVWTLAAGVAAGGVATAVVLTRSEPTSVPVKVEF